MSEAVVDKDLELKWSFYHQDLKVLHKGKIMFNSLTGFVSGVLSPQQVQWISLHYSKSRFNYIF